MKLYHASVYSSKHGDFIGVIYAFTLTEFNGLYIDYQNRFYCYITNKTIIDFDNKLSEQEVIEKLYEYRITVMKSEIPIDELDKLIKEVNNGYHFETCKEEEFEHISSNDFLSKIKPSRRFSVACVEIGVKSTVI